jgi:hypothetical protein
MDREYYLNNGKEQTKDYDFYDRNRNSINITQKYYNEEQNNGPKPVEIIQDTLYWVASDEPPKSEGEAFYFSTDNSPELQYDPFHKDFGPLNLAMTHRFCCELTKMLHEKKEEN